MARYSNTVPLGQEGTGAAQVLPRSSALQYVLQNDAQQKERLLREQQAYQQTRRGYDNQFQKSLLELSENAVSPAYQNDLSTMTNNLVKQGAELRAQGINPYNPNQSGAGAQAVQQWQQEVVKLKQAKVIADEYYKSKQQIIKDYNANPSSFDDDDYKKAIDFDKENNLNDLMSGRVERPSLEKIQNLGSLATKELGEIYSQGTVMDSDENGNPIRREVKTADMPRIASVVNSKFSNDPVYMNEVNRKLRKEVGPEFTASSLLGITDRDELKRIMDAQYRNDPSGNNPLVRLMSTGEISSLESKEYEDFLNKAVDDQYKAEKILEDEKQYVANSLVGKVNTKDSWRFDFTLKNQKMKEQAFNTSERNKNAAYQNTLLTIQKKLSGGNDGDDELLSESTDVDFSTENNPSGVKVWGSIPLNTSQFSINPSDATNVITGEKVKTRSIRGGISGVGLVGYDKNGKVVNGQTPEEIMSNPNISSFKPQVIVQNSQGRTYTTYDIDDVPIETLPKTVQAKVKKAISIQKRTASEMNNQIKNKSTGSKNTVTPVVKLNKGSLDNL